MCRKSCTPITRGQVRRYMYSVCSPESHNSGREPKIAHFIRGSNCSNRIREQKSWLQPWFKDVHEIARWIIDVHLCKRICLSVYADKLGSIRMLHHTDDESHLWRAAVDFWQLSSSIKSFKQLTHARTRSKSAYYEHLIERIVHWARVLLRRHALKTGKDLNCVKWQNIRRWSTLEHRCCIWVVAVDITKEVLNFDTVFVTVSILTVAGFEHVKATNTLRPPYRFPVNVGHSISRRR